MQNRQGCSDSSSRTPLRLGRSVSTGCLQTFEVLPPQPFARMQNIGANSEPNQPSCRSRVYLLQSELAPGRRAKACYWPGCDLTFA